jgi:hypothetical protein
MPHYTVNFGSQRDAKALNTRITKAWATVGAPGLRFPANSSNTNISKLEVDEMSASKTQSALSRQTLLEHKLTMGMSQYNRPSKSKQRGKASTCSPGFPDELMEQTHDSRPDMRVQAFKQSWSAPTNTRLGNTLDLMASSKDVLLCNMLNNREWKSDKNAVELGRRNMYAAVTSLRREKQKMTMNGWVDCSVPGQHWRRIVDRPKLQKTKK